jgi:hypothetical protein
MAKKKAAKKKARRKTTARSSARSISLVALHGEFKKIRTRINRALQLAPKSPSLGQLLQDLTAAEQLMDCSQTFMGIGF